MNLKNLTLASPQHQNMHNNLQNMTSKQFQSQSSRSDDQLKKFKLRLTRNSNERRDNSEDKPFSYITGVNKQQTKTEPNEPQFNYNTYFQIKFQNKFNRKNQSSVNVHQELKMDSTNLQNATSLGKDESISNLQTSTLSQNFANGTKFFNKNSSHQKSNTLVDGRQNYKDDDLLLEDPPEMDPNCTIYIIYKKNKIQCKLNVTNRTTDWLNQQLRKQVILFERNTLKNPNAEEEAKKIVCFQSANKNISVSYFISIKFMDLDLFEHATISLQPYIYEKQILPANYQYNLRDFDLIKCIGLGGFSRVYLITKKETGKMYALKLIDKEFIIKNKKEVIVSNERNIMAKIQHPFLLKMEYAFESKDYLGFVMEYCAGGELFYHLRRIKRMSEDMARYYFAEICLGIEYLHDRCIIYRDIKPENILLDHEGHVRVGDFGLSKPDMDINEFAYSFCGSPEYMAPEMLLKVGHTYTVDYYCLGALLYELVTGLPPYYSHNTEVIYESILSEELSFPDHVKLSSDLKNLLRGLLVKHPMNRTGVQSGIKEIFRHSWFKKVNLKEILEKKYPPPIKPDILAFNFDEVEFSKGEKEFRKKLIQCSVDMQDVKYNQIQIFKNFYYENTPKEQFKENNPSQNQSQQLNSKSGQSSGFQTSQKRQLSGQHNKHQSMTQNSISKANNYISPTQENLQNTLMNSKLSTEIISPLLSQKNSTLITTSQSSSLIKKPTHLKNATSMTQTSYQSTFQTSQIKHIKSNSANKMLQNNFMVSGYTHKTNTSNVHENSQISQIKDKSKIHTEEDFQDEHRNEQFSSGKRIMTETNRKQRALVKVQRKTQNSSKLLQQIFSPARQQFVSPNKNKQYTPLGFIQGKRKI